MTGVVRWRHNPLRRATDRFEAWLALVAFLLLMLAAPALGWLCGTRTDAALQAVVRAQRAERHPTTAVVVRRVTAARFTADPETSTDSMRRTAVVARWRAPDGSARTAEVRTAGRNANPGTRVRIWTDRRGDPTTRPMDAATGHTHAALAGFGAALLAALLIECGRRLILWRMTQRRYERIDRAWAAVGPDWGRTGAGS
ncbi:Rv1733c family protein [Streptomyces sp. NBC_00525]|uniref:Rv1733c family protein n=1 Tax=Streptomyces sp. NBC_00525 TaxID=2903660 RepID=UPI002E8095F4|nr:hypothetical protein [Streptomyces sp. NBC_00525]WUC92440.1 hypothetical protein OG710_01930 [Streptomyces sp. NBC_00525]